MVFSLFSFFFFLSILAAPAAGANQVKYVSHSAESLAAFHHIVGSAKETIDLTTFIFEPCHASTLVLMNELSARAAAGVRVRVLLDAFMQSAAQKKNLAAYFAAKGVELRWYNQGVFNVNFRTHTKLLVVDGKSYLAGGRNLADDYFGLYRGENFVDRDLYVRGPAAAEAARAFEALWRHPRSVNAARANGPFPGWEKACGSSEAPRVAAIARYLRENTARLLSAIPTRECPRVEFVVDEPGAIFFDGREGQWEREARRSGKLTSAEYIRFMKDTRSRFAVENWSFMPHESQKMELHNLRWRRVPVLAFTNDEMDAPGALKHAEKFYNDAAVKLQSKGSVNVIQVSMRGALRDDWALSPPGTLYRLHSKIAVRDHRDSLVGSFNLDPRSTTTNLEAFTIVRDCPALAGDLEAEMKALHQVYRADVKNGVISRPVTNPLWKLLAFLGSSFF